MEGQLNFITIVASASIPIGLYIMKNLNDLCKRIARLEGRHIEADTTIHDLQDK